MRLPTSLSPLRRKRSWTAAILGALIVVVATTTSACSGAEPTGHLLDGVQIEVHEAPG